LSSRNPQNLESRLLVASTAIYAERWGDARQALAPVADVQAPPRVCRLMAELEEREHGDMARARTWLKRASGGLDHSVDIPPASDAGDAAQEKTIEPHSS